MTNDENSTNPTDTSSNRQDDGKFKPGKSGNPNGRPKGSKNQITLLKESLELQLREQAAVDMSAVLEKAVELALEGDRTMLKLLLELHLSKGTTVDNSKAAEKVTINVNGPGGKVEKIPSDEEVALLKGT